MEPRIDFQGPFSWFGGDLPCVFDSDAAKHMGVYVWTANTSHGEFAYYIGDTGRTFAARFLEHLKEYASGVYRIYDADAFTLGEKRLVWLGSLSRPKEERQAAVLEFFNRMEEFAPQLRAFLHTHRLYLAPFEGEQRLRRRIEAGLARHWYDQQGLIGEFQDPGIWYQWRKADEQPIEVTVTFPSSIQGLNNTILA